MNTYKSRIYAPRIIKGCDESQDLWPCPHVSTMATIAHTTRQFREARQLGLTMLLARRYIQPNIGGRATILLGTLYVNQGNGYPYAGCSGPFVQAKQNLGLDTVCTGTQGQAAGPDRKRYVDGQQYAMLFGRLKAELFA